MKTGAGSIDGDVGMRFIRTNSAVAAITETIDCSAYNTSAGVGGVFEWAKMIFQKCARVQPCDCRSAPSPNLTGMVDAHTL